MAGGTHVFDMIKRLKQNEELKKKNYFKAKSAYTRISKTINVEYRQASDLERQQIRRRIIEERRNQKVKVVLTLVISAALTGLLVLLFLKVVKL